MYGQKKIQERIEAISRQTGWVPEYHSLGQIESFKDHCKEIFKIDGRGYANMTREFNYDELDWIRNEYNLSACDYRYWSDNYAYIKDAENNIRHFTRRSSQEMLLRLWAEREESNFSIEQIILKGRQQGVSTEVEMAITHRVNFGFGVNAAVASSSDDQAERMSGMMQLAYNEMPFWMQAPRTSERAGSLLAFGGNATRLSIYTGRAINGIARGDTPTVIHLSEVADWPNPRAIIENSLFKAVHPSPRVFMILESTGNGNVGWWPDQWHWAKDNFYTGGSRLQPVFFPWFLATDLFPTSTWIREHPVPDNWLPQSITERMIDKCVAYARHTPLMRELLGGDWVLPRHQAWFWEFNYLEHAGKHNAKGWLQEMACVTGDTRVSTNLGIIKIEDARESNICESGEVVAWIPRGQKPIYELQTRDGRILRATSDHLIHTTNGWKELQSLSQGYFIVISQPMFASETYTHKWADTRLFHSEKKITTTEGEFLGYFMGDGCFDGQGINIACDVQDEDVIGRITRIIEILTGKTPRSVRVGNMVRLYSANKYWMPFLKSLGALKPKINVEGRTNGWNRKVCVPECIFRSPKEVVRAFLSALYECDGHAYKESPRVKLYSSHDSFLRDVQLLLLGFGVRAKFMKQSLRAGGTVKGGKRHEYTGRSLETPAAFANQFYSAIGFIGERKQNSGKRQISQKYAKAEMIDEVLSVTPTGTVETVYDLTVDETHRFSANGIEVHNCDDIEALQPKKDLVFDLTTTEEMYQKRSEPTVWAIIGEQILEKHHPQAAEVDYTQDRFRVTYNGIVHDVTGKRNKELVWEFVPMLATKSPDGSVNLLDRNFNSDCKLLVFEWPEEGYDYSIGNDTAAGGSGDNTTISVNRRSRTGRDPDVQVAEFASNQVSSAEAHAYMLAICALYSMEMVGVSEPLVATEQVRGPGDNVQLQMKMHGYKRFYKFSRLDGKRPKSDQKKSKKEGWYSYQWSRDFMLDIFKHAVENGWYVLNSPFLLRNEIPAFQIDQGQNGKVRYDHESGKHDDRIFAAAIAYIIANDTESMSKRVEHKFAPNEDELPEIDLSPVHSLSVSYDQIAEGFNEA